MKRIRLLTPADLKALERLRRVSLRGCRISSRGVGDENRAVGLAPFAKGEQGMQCPCCGGPGGRLLVALNPGVVVECPGCGEVWREVPAHV